VIDKNGLSYQDKLALMMTAVKSQRKLAEFMGISHQKLGRWLREGEPNGVKKIPDNDILVREGIDAVFDQYIEVTKARYIRDNLPFDPRAPIYQERKPLRTGEPGERVVSENTQYIRTALRHRIMVWNWVTQKYIAFSVRSTINLALYNNRAEKDMFGVRRTDAQKQYRREFRHELKAGIVHKPIYTKMENIAHMTDIDLVIRNVDRKIRQKHEPATGEKGTALTDAYLWQLKRVEKPRKPAKNERTSEDQQRPRKEKTYPTVEKLRARKARAMERARKRRDEEGQE
jgi:hypothetical protein